MEKCARNGAGQTGIPRLSAFFETAGGNTYAGTGYQGRADSSVAFAVFCRALTVMLVFIAMMMFARRRWSAVYKPRITLRAIGRWGGRMVLDGWRRVAAAAVRHGRRVTCAIVVRRLGRVILVRVRRWGDIPAVLAVITTTQRLAQFAKDSDGGVRRPGTAQRRIGTAPYLTRRRVIAGTGAIWGLVVPSCPSVWRMARRRRSGVVVGLSVRRSWLIVMMLIGRRTAVAPVVGVVVAVVRHCRDAGAEQRCLYSTIRVVVVALCRDAGREAPG